MELVLAAIAFTISLLVTRYLCRPHSKLYKLDHPNPRSLHENPTPRGGGLGIVAGALISGMVAANVYGAELEFLWLGVAALSVASVSLADDWLSLPPGIRMVVHFAAAGLLLWAGFGVGHLVIPSGQWVVSDPLAIGLALLFIVWMVNLYNFMDGMDGLAAGMAVIGFGGFALLGWLGGQPLFAALSLVVAAAAGGFLLFNFPPARIFMGDVGSSFLGLMAAVFMLWAERDGIFPLWVGVLVFSPFIVDATVTLIKRILRRERFWEAHKTHYYQRLAELGWGHRRTVLWEYGLMLLCVVSALAARGLNPTGQWGVIGFWSLAYVTMTFAVHRLEGRRRRAVTR